MCLQDLRLTIAITLVSLIPNIEAIAHYITPVKFFRSLAVGNFQNINSLKSIMVAFLFFLIALGAIALTIAIIKITQIASKPIEFQSEEYDYFLVESLKEHREQ